MDQIPSVTDNFVDFGWEASVRANGLAERAGRGAAEQGKGFGRFGVGGFPDNGGPFAWGQ